MTINNVLIVGVKGQMGSMLAGKCVAAGVGVRGIDQPLTEEAMAEACEGVDVVLVCVPAAAMKKVARLCAGAMTETQIMADICSVKVNPMNTMLEAHAGPVVGTHPLFGPAPAAGEDRVAMVCGRDDAAYDAMCALVEKLGFTPFDTDADEHDMSMALIQGLNFVTSVSYLSALSHNPALENFVTPSFTRRLEASRKMLTQDSELFAGFLEENPYTQEAVRRFRSMLNIAAGGDIELLCARANWWWRDDDTKGGV